MTILENVGAFGFVHVSFASVTARGLIPVVSGFVVSKTKKIQRFFLPIFEDFSKTFESNQLSKNCECKHHFYPVINPVKSHPKMRLFVDICENLASINLFY
jgi:hypothetical protein